MYVSVRQLQGMIGVCYTTNIIYLLKNDPYYTACNYTMNLQMNNAN